MPSFDPSPSSSKDMFRFYAKRRRLPRWGRLLIAIVVIGIIYLVTVEAVHPPAWAGDLSTGMKSRTQVPSTDDSAVKPRANQAPLVPGDADEALPKSKGGSKVGHGKPAAEDAGEVSQPRKSKENDRAGQRNPVSGSAKSKISDMDEADSPVHRGAKLEEGAADSKLDKGLQAIFSITPDELHVRELLRPIENSGKERLRELGLRARQFRTLLESWEDIHLVHTKDSTLVRDDIIPYLSKVKDITGISLHKPRAEIIRSYENFRYFLTKLSELLFPWTAPYFADHMTLHASIKHGGRGIVLSGGDGQLKYMITSIRSMRKLGCTLPIEIMYLGDDDLEDDSRTELEAEPNVITRDMKQMVHDEGWDLRGWAGKPFAILLSSFREVIFIDADAMFFVNPESLFEDPAYQETGTLFFRDRLMFPENKRKWLQQILPKPMSKNVRQSRFWTGESGHMQESGVILVDKWRHFMAMLMVTRMNGPDRDGNAERGIIGTYDMVYGDKETFWLGWELVGDTDYAFHPGVAGNMGAAREDYDEARRHVLGGIEDAKKQAQEDEEQRQLEEKRRQGANEAQPSSKEQATDAEKKQAVEGEKKQETDAKPVTDTEQQKQENTIEAGKETADVKQGEGEISAAGKGKAYDAPPAPDSDYPDEPITAEEAIPLAQVEANVGGDVAPGVPAEQAIITDATANTEAAPAAGIVKRALDEEEEIDSLSTAASLARSRSTKNYTICAPQLLHLDRDNRPLWFNGWILDNKFDAEHSKVSSFESYMLELKEGALEADWKLEENNLCCLRSDKVYEFTKPEKQALTNIISIARNVGALGKRLRT